MIYRRLFNVPTWQFRSPFGELERMRQQMNRLLEEKRDPFQATQAGVFPLTNLSEDKENYYIRAELPGIKGDQLDIQVTGNNLAISGERKIESEEDGARYHRREREAGTFSRMIVLPGEVDTDKVDANLQNGILTVVVPKAEIAKPKQITVSS